MSERNFIPVSVFGSCVTRDIFEHLNREEEYLSLKTYIARQSVISAISPPVSIDPDNIALSSRFQKSMVQNDIEKTAFEQFEKDGSEYLIIDFIDERFDLVRIKSSWFTLSNEAVESRWYDNFLHHKAKKFKRKKYGTNYYVSLCRIDKCIAEFARRVKKIYPEDKIFIHCAYMMDEYFDESGEKRSFPDHYLRYNRRINDMLQYMYLNLKNNIPNAHLINSECRFRADQVHRWGLAPMHYQKEYYEWAFCEVKKIISSREPERNVQ